MTKSISHKAATIPEKVEITSMKMVGTLEHE